MPKIRINEINISYDEAGTGENLLLIHGLGLTRRLWVLQMPVFSKYYRTIAIDCRGHGDSDKPSTQHTTHDLSEDLFHFMNVLDLRKVHILGLSMGGMIAQLFALDHPEKVDKLILADTLSHSHSEYVNYLLHNIETNESKALAESVARGEIKWGVPEDIRRIIKEDVERNPKDAYIRDVKAEMDFNVTDRIHLINLPTLIIVGEQDRLMNDAHLLNSEIKGSKLAIIKRSGHLTCIENPEEFNRTVLEFLRSP